TTSNQVPQYARTYGARHISRQTLTRSVGENHYLAVLDQRGDVLAGTPGLTAQARSDLRISAALELVRSGRPYALGNLLPYGSSDVRGHYYDQVPLANSTWKVLLSAPDGPLFASVTGLRKWVPWLIFIAFAVVALVALVFAVRALRAADQVRDAKARLEEANQELERAHDRLRRHAQELTRSNADLEQFASIASHV